jgi:ElaB/YqjD/DUF883 family membrane-anchored ribosome-binding protein
MASPREPQQPQDPHNDSASASQELPSLEDVRDTAQELGTQVGEVATAYYAQGRERALAFERTLETQVREKPLQSVLLAGGVGFLLGLLWRR